MTNVKKIGSDFEKEFCGMLTKDGFWNHFFTPDARGAQPFDVVAVRKGKAYAIDCKTCVANYFTLDRLEDNQMYAFEHWTACGNGIPWIAVKHEGEVYMVAYQVLVTNRKVKLSECDTYAEWEKWLYE